MQNDNKELKWSLTGSKNKIIFKSKYNYLNIIVEDKTKLYFYEILFEKFNFNFEFKIIASESKQNSIKFFKDIKNAAQYANELYFFIVDGDFDIFFEKEVIKTDNFLYLRRYNIESYLLQEDAVYNALRKNLKIEKSKIKQIFHFTDWYNLVANDFINLFLIFMINFKYNLGLKTVGSGIKFLDSEKGTINKNRQKELLYEIEAKKIDINNEINKIRQNILNKGLPLKNIICGKFLLDSICLYVNYSSDKNYIVKKKGFDADIISEIDPYELFYLRDKIILYMKNVCTTV